VLRLIKQHRPESAIYWWIAAGLAPLLEGDPDLAGVIPFHRRGWVRPQHWRNLFRDFTWMREQRFDWVIDLQSLARSGAFAWLANGELTVGLDETREGARGFYDLAARRQTWHTHAVDWYLSVLPLLGVPSHRNFVWMPQRPAVEASLHERWPQLSQKRWIIVQPGARWLNKRWPVEHYADFVREISVRNPEVRFAVLGSEEDRQLGQAICQAVPAPTLDLTGKLSLPEMVEWIRASSLMVTNDTGPMHVAAALGKPLIALFGPTEPRRTGPYGEMDDVFQLDLPCVPCMASHCRFARPLECLKALPVRTVVRRAAEVLSIKP
jgi:lipopolysaccharide heptosyltransferase II